MAELIEKVSIALHVGWVRGIRHIGPSSPGSSSLKGEAKQRAQVHVCSPFVPPPPSTHTHTHTHTHAQDLHLLGATAIEDKLQKVRLT